jgi:hypothetical protein
LIGIVDGAIINLTLSLIEEEEEEAIVNKRMM